MFVPVVRVLCVLLLFGFVVVGTTFAQDMRVLNEGRFLIAEKKFDQALQKFDAILKSHPNHLEAKLGKMEALGSQRKTSDVAKVAGVAKAGGSADELTLSGYNKFWKKDFPGALADFNSATQKDANAYMAHYLAGYLNWRLIKYDQALVHLEKTVKLKPDMAEAYYILGEIYKSKGDAKKVITYWNEYMKRIPHSGTRFDYVNNTLKKLGGQ
ncbi:tetratricopeptide repeat protein [Acanthopleuribacter pedis]|uniref:Tetratricopeptide repeat protein n=1 Tax=Acanthopleuribacter pedis TaxID=442870 RepID=A0A8J7U3C5_9BACT|nr:tetratricopeptide repeat protein [Acanthopleuribacter pedis]MBO1317121.1 tetratricopeptide repeat protein [Acanthopleuribacter pedis]